MLRLSFLTNGDGQTMASKSGERNIFRPPPKVKKKNEKEAGQPIGGTFGTTVQLSCGSELHAGKGRR